VINDPLLYDFELPLRETFYPLGFPLEVFTNSEEVLAAAGESWGLFHLRYALPAVRLYVAVLPGGTSECPSLSTVRGQRNLVIRVADQANFSISDISAGFSYAWVTAAAVAHRAHFRYDFLEAMGWDVLQPAHFTPIHAACVQLTNRGVLLCGDSGAGKSSLAYTCAREGWEFLSDDSCRLIRRSNSRTVVGNPYQIRFRDSGVRLFPELKDRRITRRMNGKLSIELRTACIPAIKTVTESSIEFIVFLKRGEKGPPRLAPLSREVALGWFHKVINWGTTAMRDEQAASLARLLDVPIYELRYNDLRAAAAQLETMARGNRTPDRVRVQSESCEHA
jgi:HPr Serine kinase C-terminal domain